VINPVKWPELVACVKKQVTHIKLWQKGLKGIDQLEDRVQMVG